MAFPTIPTVAAGRVLFANDTGTASPSTRTFPAFSGLTYSNGDLLIAIVATYQSTTNPQFSSWSNGFTECSDQGTSTTMGIGVAYKWTTGSETGSLTVSQAGTVTGEASMVLLAIPGAHASTAPECGTKADGTSTAANPGALSPSWGAEDTLWVAIAGSGMTSGTGSWTATGTTYPTNYTNGADSNTTDSSRVGQVEIAVAFRQLNAASEDVATFGVDTSNARNSALVIAVRPAPALNNYEFTGGAEAGAFAVSGAAATLLDNQAINAAAVSYAVTGSDVGLSKGHLLDASPASYSIAGANATLTADRVLDASAGSYAVAGSDVQFATLHNHEISADAGSFSITGADATFTTAVEINFNAEPGAVTVYPGDPYFTQVQLLMHFDGANDGTSFPDSSSQNRTQTRQGVVTKTATKKFGTASGFFDGSGDWVYSTYPPPQALYDWWSQDTTFETWIYPTSLTGWSWTSTTERPTLWGHGNRNGSQIYWGFGPRADGTVALWYVSSGTQVVASTATVNLNEWNHIAFTKTSAGIRIWVNGVGTTAVAVVGTPLYSTTYEVVIGQTNSTSINGYVDELRLTVGTARYAADFTPPAAAFSNSAGVAASLLQGYAINAQPASYAVSGADATLTAAQTNTFMDAQPGSYALSGQAASLLQDCTLNAQPGSYTATGTAATVLHDHFVDAQPGSYALSGQAASLLQGYAVDAQPAAYTVSGQASSLARDRTLDAQPGAYTFSGVDATLTYQSLGAELTADPAAYTVTGSPAELLQGYAVNAQAGSYALTGQTASLAAARALDAQPSTYTLSGAVVTALRALALDAQPGSYALVGADAIFVGAGEFNAEPGTYAVSGTTAVLARHLTISVDAGSYAATGAAAGTYRDRTVDVSAGSYAATGAAAGVYNDHTVSLDSASYALSSFTATVLADRMLSADAASYGVSGAAAGVYNDHTVSLDPASYALSGSTATVLADRTLSVDAVSYAVGGAAAQMVKLSSGEIDVTEGTFGVSGAAAVLAHHRLLAAAAGSLDLSGAQTGYFRTYIGLLDSGSFGIDSPPDWFVFRARVYDDEDITTYVRLSTLPPEVLAQEVSKDVLVYTEPVELFV